MVPVGGRIDRWGAGHQEYLWFPHWSSRACAVTSKGSVPRHTARPSSMFGHYTSYGSSNVLGPEDTSSETPDRLGWGDEGEGPWVGWGRRGSRRSSGRYPVVVRTEGVSPMYTPPRSRSRRLSFSSTLVCVLVRRRFLGSFLGSPVGTDDSPDCGSHRQCTTY